MNGVCTSKRCIVFYDSATEEPSRSFAFATDSDKVQFVNYMMDHIEDFKRFCADGCKLLLNEHGTGGMQCIYMEEDHFRGERSRYHHLYPCATDEQKLAFANWIQAYALVSMRWRLLNKFDDHFHSEVRVVLAEMHVPLDSNAVHSFLVDKTGEPGLADKIVDTVCSD